jgi:hypothetical protein
VTKIGKGRRYHVVATGIGISRGLYETIAYDDLVSMLPPALKIIDIINYLSTSCVYISFSFPDVIDATAWPAVEASILYLVGEALVAKTTTNLYRAVFEGTLDGDLVTDGVPQTGLLDPRWDVDVTVTASDDGPMVGTSGGTSLHNVDGWFGFARCRYFCIPQDTPIPDSLKVKKGRSKRTNKAGNRTGYHYQIEPLNRMTVDALKGALDNFARNAVVRQVELANV